MPLSLEQILALNQEGMIPGPGETEESFAKRVQFTQQNHFDLSQSLPPSSLQWASEQLVSLFGFIPRWIRGAYSTQDLYFWEAGATWIDAQGHCFIRLRPYRKYLPWVIPEEVLAHEAVHVARAAFDEPEYEELFAYCTASAGWRKIFGPLIARTYEVVFLLGSLWGGVIAILAGYEGFAWLFFMIGLGLFMTSIMRLLRLRMRLERAAKHLIPYLRNAVDVRPLLFRMTDQEIKRAAHGQVGPFPQELRWRVLKAAYWKSIHQ